MTYSRENSPKYHIAIFMRMKQQFHLNALCHGKLSTNPSYDFRMARAIISNNRNNNIVTRSYRISASLFAHPITFLECVVTAKVTGYYDGACVIFPSRDAINLVLCKQIHCTADSYESQGYRDKSIRALLCEFTTDILHVTLCHKRSAHVTLT